MLFKATLDLTAFVSINKNYNFASLKGAIETAQEQYLLPLLGEKLFEWLDAEFNKESITLNTLQKKLLLKTQAALAFYTMYERIPEGNVHVNELGLQQTSSDDYDVTRPATDQAVNRLEASYLLNGYRKAEGLLQFLESNSKAFPDWEHSEAFAQSRETFIRSFSEMQNHIPQLNSRKVFLYARPQLRLAMHKYIRPALGDAFYNFLLDKWIHAKELNAPETEVIQLIQPALAWASLHDLIATMPIQITMYGLHLVEMRNEGRSIKAPDTYKTEAFQRQCDENAKSFLALLKNMLHKQANYLPEYKESDAYEAPEDKKLNLLRSDNSLDRSGFWL